MATVFEELRDGAHYDIRNEKYLKEVHGEISRCRHLCWLINGTDPDDVETIKQKEHELIPDMSDDAFLTPPFQIDCGCTFHLGKNAFANHGLTVMSVGTVVVEDGVMMGPEVGLFTVNHEPADIRRIYTGVITIKKNAWIGARVNIMPGVTVGEGAIVASGAVVTHDVEPHTLVAGVPARVIRKLQ
ncbi:MAG: sugar O-acetyltransferase [Prevotella sp.]